MKPRSPFSIVNPSLIFRTFRSHRLARNGFFSLVQSLVGAVCLFLVYRLVVSNVGLDMLGVWSLLLAGSAIARVGDLSGGGALARFVAMPVGSCPEHYARDTVHTVVLTSLAFNFGLAGIVWLLLPWAMDAFLDPEFLTAALALMPLVVANLIFSALGLAVTSAIDGVHRADKRAGLMTVASLLFLAGSMVLIPALGLVGFALAQLAQQAFTILVGWIVLRGHIKQLGWFPTSWTLRAFRQTTSYALKLNAIGLVVLLFEPLAKFAFNGIGGPGAVGLFELASRLVSQARAPITSAATPLIPAFAAQRGVDDPAFRKTLYMASVGSAWAAVLVAALCLIGAPAVSLVILGMYSADLVNLSIALTMGWCLNLLGLGFYLAGQAHGVLRWNFLGHAITAAAVVCGAAFMVPVFGESGLISAIVFGLSVGSLVTTVGNANILRSNSVLLKAAPHIAGAAASISGLCAAYWLIESFIRLQT